MGSRRQLLERMMMHLQETEDREVLPENQVQEALGSLDILACSSQPTHGGCEADANTDELPRHNSSSGSLVGMSASQPTTNRCCSAPTRSSNQCYGATTGSSTEMTTGAARGEDPYTREGRGMTSPSTSQPVLLSTTTEHDQSVPLGANTRSQPRSRGIQGTSLQGEHLSDRQLFDPLSMMPGLSDLANIDELTELSESHSPSQAHCEGKAQGSRGYVQAGDRAQ